MAVTQPQLGSNPVTDLLPYPSTFSFSRTYRGGMIEMADGTVGIDLVSTTAKHEFIMEWWGATSSEYTQITTLFAYIDDGTTTFKSPAGNTHTVSRSPDAPGLEVTSRLTAGGNLRYWVKMQLREA